MNGRTEPARWIPEGLPVLSGRARLFFLGGWCVLLLVALRAAVAVLPVMVRRSAQPLGRGRLMA